MNDYDHGRAAGANHGTPHMGAGADFMRGFQEGGGGQSLPLFTPIKIEPLPSSAPTAPSIPSPPMTIGSMASTWAMIGVVVALFYAFTTSRIGFLPAGIAGAIGGAVVGIVVWVAVKLLEAAFWLLGWALKIGLVLAAGYLLVHVLAR